MANEVANSHSESSKFLYAFMAASFRISRSNIITFLCHTLADFKIISAEQTLVHMVKPVSCSSVTF